jgi:hypothetical protein
MTDLSPQARAVLDAAHNRWLDVDDDIPAQVAAAALRALSYQCLHETPKGVHGHHARRYMLAGELRAIASELEKTND